MTDEVRARVNAGGDRFWTADELTDVASRSTVQRTLRRTRLGRELRHVRRGLYWRGPMGFFGMSLPTQEALIERILGPDGAANALSMSTQMLRHTHLAVVARAATTDPYHPVLPTAVVHCAGHH